MIALRNTWFLLLVLALPGCGGIFGVKSDDPAAKLLECTLSLNQSNLQTCLMYGQSQVGAAYKTVADLRARDAISKEDGKAAIAKIDEIDKGVKLARMSLGQGDVSTAEGQLNAALTALVAIEATLKAKQ